MKASRKALLAAAVAGLGIGTAARAATITFSSAQVVFGDSDVINTGTLVNATNIVGGSVTVNGTAFTQASGSTITQGDLTVSIPLGLTDPPAGTYGSLKTPFSSLSANYQSVLNSGDYQDAVVPMLPAQPVPVTETVTYTGLHAGYTYELEFFVNDSRTCCSNNTRNETLASGPNSVNLPFYNNSGVDGGLGSFATGTFTANGSTQSYTVSSLNLQNNAFVLYQVATPEPASLGLFGLGALGLLSRRRRAI